MNTKYHHQNKFSSLMQSKEKLLVEIKLKNGDQPIKPKLTLKPIPAPFFVMLTST